MVFRTNDRLLVFSGDDHLDWLQGQITQNVLTAQAGSPVGFAVASATGQIQGYGQLYRGSDTTTIICDVTTAYVLRERVQKYVILEDVELMVSDSKVWSAQGALALDMPETGFLNNRFGTGGYDFALPPEEEHHHSLTASAHDLLRLESGWPTMGIDTTEKTLVAELGPSFVEQTVNYEKGCYTGQEVLMRIYSRGHVNRQRVGLLLEGPQEELGPLVDEAGVECGTVQQIAEGPRMGWIATGYVRREALESGRPVWLGKTKCRVSALPFS